ncbi:MAG: ATP-binding protein [Campylobacterales bacterium]|nr:ATP-binding protein [Campylobacterales bacterium]
MKNLFKKIITDFIEKEIKGIVPRAYAIPLESKKVISLIGVRRSGKSSILFDCINRLRETTSRENMIYLNFEDDRLYPLRLEHLDLILESYFELYPRKREEKIYLFLDEVQVVEGWELYVRRVHDTFDISIFVTGSSAKLLSTEIATSLRGRTISFEIFPFSFAEYLAFKNIEVNLHSSKSLSFIKNSFEVYLVDGGFAETIAQEREIARRILSDYLELIVFKDIAERHNISNTALLKHLNKYCFTNIATLLSVTKLYNEFKSQGYKLSKDTIFNYMAYLEDAYALFSVPIFRNSIKEEQRNPKKIYAVDNGFKKMYSIGDDKSKLYENLAFLHLRRQTKEVYYYKGTQEVDFYAKLHDKALLVNVSYEIKEEQTKRREINGLLEAMAYFSLNEGYLVTHDEKEEITVEGKKIMIVPMSEWLLCT